MLKKKREGKKKIKSVNTIVSNATGNDITVVGSGEANFDNTASCF